ncbi:unnamed protein product [Prunus brigantina]
MENSNNIKGLVCLMIFSSAIVVLIFPVSVGASWRCLGATEYKFVIENHFGEAFMQQHSGDDIEFYCHSASSSPWTLSHPSKDFRRKRMSLFKLVEFGICGGWLEDAPSYNCSASTQDGRWSTIDFPVLRPENDCVKTKQFCEWHLHDDHALLYSPTQNSWTRFNYI